MNAAVEETWQDVKDWVHKTVWDYRRQAGGDVDELEAEAGLHFIRAYRNFDRRRAAFTTHVRFTVMRGLQETGRVHILKDANRRQTRNMNVMPARSGRDVVAWIDNLPDDAKTVIALALRPTPEIILEATVKRGRPHCPSTLRSAIYDYLRWEGWTPSRIAAAFKLVADELQGD